MYIIEITMSKYSLQDIIERLEFNPKNGVKLLQIVDEDSDSFDLVSDFCKQVLNINDIDDLSQSDLRDYLTLQERFKTVDSHSYDPEWTDDQMEFFITRGAKPKKGCVPKCRKLFKQRLWDELEPLLEWVVKTRDEMFKWT